MARVQEQGAAQAVALSRGSGGLGSDRNVVGPIFSLPAVAVLGVFLAYPFALGIWLAFTDTIIGGTGRFIGVENYVSLWRDPLARLATFNTFLYTVAAGVFKLTLGLGLAILLNRSFRGQRFVRAIVLLPWIVPTALSALAWWWLYDTSFSVINWVLVHLGVIERNLNFLGEPNLARASVIVANIWRGVPFYAITLLAGLQTISRELYEAAEIDGAGSWGAFRYITWPLLAPITAVTTMFSTIWTFSDFQLVWVLTRGGPANATHLLGTVAYQRAILGGQFGEGAAIASFIFPVLLFSMIVTLWTLRRGAKAR